jgi:hypothetical protein
LAIARRRPRIVDVDIPVPDLRRIASASRRKLPAFG